jgi:Fic-DOC domain mobile mystery protein B
MGLELKYKDGQTPLAEEEAEGLLIKNITTHGELDEFEQQNIEKAIEWTLYKKFKKEQILSEEFVCKLHYKMFCDVWAWAGKFRKSEKNLGVKAYLIRTFLKQLNDDCLYWVENKTYPDEEIAIRYKHLLVNIHGFSNGNGRHSRLMADILMSQIWQKSVFTWSSRNLVSVGEARTNYLTSIHAADRNEIEPLIAFAKS